MILLYDDPSLCCRLLFASQGAGPALLARVHRKLRSNAAAGPLPGSLLAPSVLHSRHKNARRKQRATQACNQPTACAREAVKATQLQEPGRGAAGVKDRSGDAE